MHSSDPDGLLTSPMVPMPPHMLQRFSMSSFKLHKSSFLRQLLRWLKISCIGQKVNCGQHTVKTPDFWSTSSFLKFHSSFDQGLIMIHQENSRFAQKSNFLN